MAKGILGIFLDEAKKRKGIESLPEGDVDVEAGDLQFLMNTGPGGIEKAQRLGGFPMPSLAITRQDLPFESFGEITLVGSPDKFGPGKIKANVVFDADAYTVRAPRPFRIAKKNADRDFQKKYTPLAKEFDEGGVDSIVYELGNMETKKMATAGSFDDVVRFFESGPVADVAFLRDQGDSRPIPKNSYGSIDRSGLQKMVREYGNARKMWSKDQLNKIFEPEEVFDASVNRDFYTGKGRIFKPYTGEEVVKFMKKRRGAAQEEGAFSVSPGKLRASLTERLTSLKKIKEQSPRLVDKEKFATFKNDSYDRVNDLAESLKPFYRFDGDAFGYSDEVIELLIESEKRNLSRALDEFGFDDVPGSVIDEIQATKSYFRNAPTEYFEAKPQRLVDLEEFEGAIVPQDTPENVLKAFEDAGIKVEYYADSAERLSARKKFAGTAFSLAGGITLVGLTAPQETEAGVRKELRRQRRKRAKKQGFDVDAVYYHGADADITEFRMPSRETGQTKTVGTGVFMSSSPDTASSFAKAHSQTVYPVYLNKSDFLTVRPPEKGQTWGDLSVEGMTVELPDGTTKPANEVFDLEGISTDTDELARQARNQGRKGIIFKDVVDVGMGGSGEYRHVNKYLQDRGYDVSLPLGTTKESFEKEQAVPREVMRAARLYAKEKVFQPADTVVSFDPANIRSVNAEFDPEQAGWSDDILASGLVTAGGIAALSPGEAEAGPLRKGISEQGLERAKKLGFDVDNVMYHASKQDIDEFVPAYSDGLVFLTPDKKFANNWLGKGKFKERQGGTGAIEGVKAERERFREEGNKILKSLPEDQRQQYYEEVLLPQDQQLSRDIEEADRVIYPVVTKAKKPFVPHKDYEVLEELIGKERMDSPFSQDFPQLRDGYKSGNYLLYENLEVVEFLRSKGYDSMFLQESPWTKTDTESPEYSTFAVFDPTDIRSVNAEFDPEKLSSPNILASGLAATGIAALSPGEAEAMQKTIEQVERDFPGLLADSLTGAGDSLTGAKEVVLDILGDVASPLGRVSAPTLLESLSQDPLTAEQIKEAAERGASFFDYKIKTPTGKRYREAVTTGVESLFDYLSESGGSLDPVQFGFQKGVIPILEALDPVAEAYVEGALDLDAAIRDEEDREREKAWRESAQPAVEKVLTPI